MKALTWLAVPLVLSGLVACGGGPSGGGTAGGHDHGGGDAPHMSTEAFGSAGDPDETDRTVAVATLDSLEFDPEELEVEVGDTVTFEVTNEGSTDHEFVIGDAAYQRAHGPAMEGMEHDDGNGVFLEPGADGTVTWTFTEPGEVLYACHVNGHYEAGMVGRIDVR